MKRTDGKRNDVGRRDLLRTGAVALGAALLPRAAVAKVQAEPAARGDLVEQLRADYWRRVREIAQRLGPQLADFHYDPESDDWEEPAALLERECKASLCPTVEDARLAWAFSSHWDKEEVTEWYDIRKGVAIVVALDVATVAGFAWYTRCYLGDEMDGADVVER